MATEHDTITDPYLREPKGAAAASAGTVYVSDGAASGAWEHTLMSDHASMVITNNATATSTTAAADSTLNTDSDYTKITAGWALTHSAGITFNVDELVVAVTGDYKIDFWGTLKIPTNNNFVGVKYAINDTTPYSTQKIKAQAATANDYRNISASAMVSLTAGDTISVYAASTSSDSLVFEEAGVAVLLVHE